MTLRKVTWHWWCVTRSLESSRRGVTWPMPGLGSTAMWDFMGSCWNEDASAFAVAIKDINV